MISVDSASAAQRATCCEQDFARVRVQSRDRCVNCSADVRTHLEIYLLVS